MVAELERVVEQDGQRGEELFERILRGQRDGHAGNAQPGEPGPDGPVEDRLGHEQHPDDNQQTAQCPGDTSSTIWRSPAGGTGLASGTPPAASGTPPAASGTPPAASGTPPAASGTPPAASGTAPACRRHLLGRRQAAADPPDGKPNQVDGLVGEPTARRSSPAARRVPDVPFQQRGHPQTGNADVQPHRQRGQPQRPGQIPGGLARPLRPAASHRRASRPNPAANSQPAASPQQHSPAARPEPRGQAVVAPQASQIETFPERGRQQESAAHRGPFFRRERRYSMTIGMTETATTAAIANGK